MKFKPYEEYKKVDLPWIDKIPSHWEMERNKNFLTIKDETVGNKDKDYKLLSLTKKGIIERDMENPKGKFPSSFETYKIVEKNDIIFCLFDIDETPRTVGLSKLDGMITGAYNIFSINKINRNYYYYYYLYLDKFKMLKPLYTGLRKTINEDAFLRLRTPLPPKEEQDKIADFLDYNLGKIDKFVELTERQIALLKEQKEVIINDAVTKGIDKNVEYKDSGIDWIGDIPEHWEVTRLKYLTNSSFLYGANESGIQYNEELPRYIRITDIDKNGTLKDTRKRSLSNEKSKGFLLKNGDVLFARSGATVGKTFLYEYENDKACFAGYLIRFRPDFKEIVPRYLYLYTKSGLYKLWVQSIFIQSTIQNISAERYKNLVITLPPKKQQKEIVAYIEKETSKIDRTIELYKSQIELIKEYRTSLIASAVTGKIDVRNF